MVYAFQVNGVSLSLTVSALSNCSLSLTSDDVSQHQLPTYAILNNPSGPEHLPNYHEWMQDPFLLEATASEPLTMEEEIEMQKEWRDDEKKCTFIILARDLLNDNDVDDGNHGEIIAIPPIPAVCEEKGGDQQQEESYPHLIQQTLHAMIGDINLFLSEEDDYNSDDEENFHQQQQILQPGQSSAVEKLTQAELDIMIAAKSHRHKNLGVELALMMMHYGASSLQIRRFYVKIKDNNHSSIKLFKEKLGFEECAYAECFGEYEFECKRETSEEMVELIEQKWQSLVEKVIKSPSKAGDEADGNIGRIYAIYKCPVTD